jgi:hypothetical protein
MTMSSGYAYPDMTLGQPAAVASRERRSNLAALLFIVPILLSGLGYALGGAMLLTDAGFLVLTVLCVIFLIRELQVFPERQGLGGILLFGGVLVWFCHDYMTNWFMRDFGGPDTPVGPEVVARAAFYHCLFIEIMVWGINIPFMRWVEKIVVAVPEPSNKAFYFWVLLALMVFGLSPFLFFTVQPTWEVLWDAATFRSDLIGWTTGRSVEGYTQNLNYNWGGYLAQVLQVGQTAGVLGAAYAILVAEWPSSKFFGWFCWFFWCSYSYASLRRGDIAFVALPAAGLLFYKYQVETANYLRKLSLKAYIYSGLVAFALFTIVQFQGALRDRSALVLTTARGNTMFSEGIRGWAVIPDPTGEYFKTKDFPGEGIVRPIPETLFWFLIDPIPRALWNDKPVDAFYVWYSNYLTGEHTGATGTTVSGGGVGQWYFRYGPAGVIEGGLVYAWLMGLCDRSLRRARGRPIAVLFCFSFGTFVFRAYRDLWFHTLYPVMIAGVVLYIIVKPFTGQRPEGEPEPLSESGASAAV